MCPHWCFSCGFSCPTEGLHFDSPFRSEVGRADLCTRQPAVQPSRRTRDRAGPTEDGLINRFGRMGSPKCCKHPKQILLPELLDFILLGTPVYWTNKLLGLFVGQSSQKLRSDFPPHRDPPPSHTRRAHAPGLRGPLACGRRSSAATRSPLRRRCSPEAGKFVASYGSKFNQGTAGLSRCFYLPGF